MFPQINDYVILMLIPIETVDRHFVLSALCLLSHYFYKFDDNTNMKIR